ncbi:hypothetical protein A2331_00550 [Candidatus Falkowbacteria bacterium RIFOXYB2_FULL_34_18]|uniref:Uncharacterized protein n=1 Tax=Candidatus Falkowbacteria bacterium RIFOXYD2_FULL_34_120 TaxID=1798007 RepID=A0A1F5TP92_9BACT|nr:MAG: hypothetical protein A2331_00550 [Candidatus Falkowbacteria bacterium RIFOXYB2_FULL_34_18]OGF29044.1 MAG: hypothetical protein A2500_01950 [Candidatus Falkowbacteria bacterium RIFOXYC12_FULL_34_55]OGF36077.1 MAG: hypothetical protein A2466_00250 [Candidatus Falkowbacteria bacterium RIFOXYC2_FULL_34_220]OGF38555.1 MAG: hypothetical protein A2515_05210 [Candidatus Falkowbacteria bacterium RIFOXYD12_FULL_34_57]OGF40700.1 MAG: hypothetical protein A2531_05660 [Candidatus Falkowbacteria bact
MFKKALAIFIFFVCLTWSSGAQAGFGISPPYLKTDKPIFPGANYEQTITLLRSSAEDELTAKITVNAPEIESWIAIDKGYSFDLPKGQLRVPMMVRVNVPDSAEIGDYKGYINVKIVPKVQSGGSGVSIALGARIDIDLRITDKAFLDFNVRRVSIPDFEQLGTPWKWPIFSWFFYRTKVEMKIENTGNIKVAPSKVHIDVYDLTEKELLESYDDNSIEKVEPFKTETVVASFPTKLKPGQYWGKIKIYKDKDIIYKDKIAFTVMTHGELPSGTKIGVWPWVLLSLYVSLVLLFVYILIRIKIWVYIYLVLYFISFPIRFIWKVVARLIKKLKLKFWKWMHQKASKYQEPPKDEDK